MLLNAREIMPRDHHEPLILLAIEDVTQRKFAEEAQRDSEERYRSLFHACPVAVYSCDAAGVIMDFNARAAELWGREPKPGDTDERFCGSGRQRPCDPEVADSIASTPLSTGHACERHFGPG